MMKKLRKANDFLHDSAVKFLRRPVMSGITGTALLIAGVPYTIYHSIMTATAPAVSIDSSHTNDVDAANRTIEKLAAYKNASPVAQSHLPALEPQAPVKATPLPTQTLMTETQYKTKLNHLNAHLWLNPSISERDAYKLATKFNALLQQPEQGFSMPGAMISRGSEYSLKNIISYRDECLHESSIYAGTGRWDIQAEAVKSCALRRTDQKSENVIVATSMSGAAISILGGVIGFGMILPDKMQRRRLRTDRKRSIN